MTGPGDFILSGLLTTHVVAADQDSKKDGGSATFNCWDLGLKVGLGIKLSKCSRPSRWMETMVD